MPANAADAAIRYLGQEIAKRIDDSAKGRDARSQAGLEGPSRITSVLVPHASFVEEGKAVAFKAVVELHDEGDRQYEARISGVCDSVGGTPTAWKVRELDVVDATPLPTGG